MAPDFLGIEQVTDDGALETRREYPSDRMVEHGRALVEKHQ